MKSEKIHLVPQAVIDVAQGLNNTKQDNLKLNYIMRLEAIRDYCDAALKTSNQTQTFNNKPKHKYSRIGLNNV
jgi:hypothetical protein